MSTIDILIWFVFIVGCISAAVLVISACSWLLLTALEWGDKRRRLGYVMFPFTVEAEISPVWWMVAAAMECFDRRDS